MTLTVLLEALLRALVAFLVAHHPAPAATLPPEVGALGAAWPIAPAWPEPAPARGSVGSTPTPDAPTAPTSPTAPAVPAPGPDSPVCEPGQSPAREGCAQGQLPAETQGRQYGPGQP